MDKRALATNRARKPLFEKLGELDEPNARQFIDMFPLTPSSISNAVDLRNQNAGQWADEPSRNEQDHEGLRHGD